MRSCLGFISLCILWVSFSSASYRSVTRYHSLDLLCETVFASPGFIGEIREKATSTVALIILLDKYVFLDEDQQFSLARVRGDGFSGDFEPIELEREKKRTVIVIPESYPIHRVRPALARIAAAISNRVGQKKAISTLVAPLFSALMQAEFYSHACQTQASRQFKHLLRELFYLSVLSGNTINPDMKAVCDIILQVLLKSLASISEQLPIHPISLGARRKEFIQLTLMTLDELYQKLDSIITLEGNSVEHTRMLVFEKYNQIIRSALASDLEILQRPILDVFKDKLTRFLYRIELSTASSLPNIIDDTQLSILLLRSELENEMNGQIFEQTAIE